MLIASPSILQLSAKANNAKLVDSGILTPFIALMPEHNSISPTPTPVSPFAIPPHDSPERVTIALDNTFKASAKIKIEPAALISPFVLYLLNVLFSDLKDKVSIENNDAIANSDLPISSTLNFDNVSIDPAKIPIAIAIASSEVALIPVVNV